MKKSLFFKVSCQILYMYIQLFLSRGLIKKSTNYKATYLPSRKLSKLDEPDIQDTAGEAGTSW